VPLPAEPDRDVAATRRQEVVTRSGKRFGVSRAEVEAMSATSPAIRPTSASSASPPPVTTSFAATVELPPKTAEESGVSEVQQPAAKTAPEAEEDSQHNTIKERIRVQAEPLDYSVTFEDPVPNSPGRADVVLRRGKLSVACEITVTTPVEYEAGNLTKCLNGGFGHVAAISRNRTKLAQIEKLLQGTVSSEQIAKVGFYSPEEFISKIHDWALDDPDGGTAEQGKPRKRKIVLHPVHLTDAERRQREADMLKSLTEAMKQK